ncbi:MAG: protein phosphatase 2C domain-containing protein [Oscillospiraceae bacterium]|nr:protein phosphatase 2C domain-containing protein [Oscillospiraceae bacterium]
MIYAYGITAQGAYHIKNNTPCQDAHNIVKLRDNMVIAAVADGLGSMEHSDIASKLAVEVSVNYCKESIASSSNSDEILKIIEASFSLAQNTIEKEAQNNGHRIEQYDTTLTLAVMNDEILYYGHSGDSGIIALTTEGLYEKVTEQQRDDEARVFPLFFKNKWIFKQYEKNVSSVLLATDGMLGTFFPIYIKNEPVNIHVTLARFFMDNKRLHIDKLGEDLVKMRIEQFILNIPCDQVDDDKTVVVLINTDIEPSLQPDDYYKEPDWVELKRKRDEELKKLLYPNFFKGKSEGD